LPHIPLINADYGKFADERIFNGKEKKVTAMAEDAESKRGELFSG
jgi:hypothetical protein